MPKGNSASASRPISRPRSAATPHGKNDAEVSDSTWDFNRHWDHSNEWLASLLRLVESEVGFSALKFANYLEAELRLFRGLPELRGVCREARRLCRSNPRVSPYVAGRVGQLQATWLAIESRLAEFKSQKSLLTALSGDLKLLEMRQDTNNPSVGADNSQEKHMCCTKKMELLDGAIQKKDDQMQQMLNVTAAISKLLDLICTSDLLCIRGHHQPARPAALANSVVVANSPVVNGQSAALLIRDNQSASSTGSTTYVRTVTNTDGDQADRISSDSSEIITQTGHNSIRPGPSQSRDSIRPELAAREVRIHNRVAENASLEGAYETANHNEPIVPDFDTVVADSQPSKTEYAEDGPEAIDYCGPSPLLQAIGHRIVALTSSTELIQASLASAEAPESAEGRLSRLAIAETALGGCQSELASLRASVLAAAAATAAAAAGADAGGPEEAIFRRAYLESIALLTNWTGSLRDRCRSKLLELRRQTQELSERMQSI